MGPNRVVAVRVLYGCAKALLISLAGLIGRGLELGPRFPLSQTMLEPDRCSGP